MSRAGEVPQQPQAPSALPSGTVTFLFTDIEGSTERWERYGQAMRAAVVRHERIVKDAATRYDGSVFKTLGDALCIAFPTAPQAAGAAVLAQHALVAEDFSAVDGLRVRMGVHTGHADERDGDYFGPAVNRVARLTSVGHGGQVLLSATAHGLARDELPSGTSLADLGSHRLKDLAEPEHIWQLCIDGLRAEFPPLRSLDARPNNLPLQLTSFVGREQDIADTKAFVARHRLLTLVGSGGVGKTRLAVQAGAELLDQHPDGVWFVDFAPIADPALVSSVTAQVLGMSQHAGGRIDEALPSWLKRKRLLIIFDNCEHVLEPVARLASAILQTAPDVRIVSTSREPLGIGGEVVHRLPSLSVPSGGGATNAEHALRYDAVALFVDRATAVDTRFALTDDTARIVGDICRRLDGIPLAIELAAARVKVLSIPNLAQRLDERFKLLTGGSRAVLPRQQTLSALIDWSHDLLTPQERSLFRRLSVFAGGFGLDAATRVCAGEGQDEIAVLELLASLADKSLVVADTSGRHERYHLLESTRAYSSDKLSAAGECDSVAGRHAAYFSDLAKAAAESLVTGALRVWLERGELELDNYRAALDWALSQRRAPVLGAAIAARAGMWSRHGLAAEGRHWIDAALQSVDEREHPRVVAELLSATASLSTGTRKFEAAERAIRLFDSSGDIRRAATARTILSNALYQMGRIEEADQEMTRALEAFRACKDVWGVAECLNQKAVYRWAAGDDRAWRELFDQALAAYKAIGDEDGIGSVLSNIAEREFADGYPDKAIELASQALELRQRGKDEANIATGYINIAAYRIELGEFEGARAAAREGLRRACQARNELLIDIALQHLAVIAGLGGAFRRAAKVLGYVDARFTSLGLERESTEQRGYEKLVGALRTTLGDDEIATLSAEGAVWSEDQAIEEALSV